MNTFEAADRGDRRTRAAEGFDRRAFSVEEVLRMVETGIIDDDERLELIDGEIVPMSPEATRHLKVKGSLNRFLTRSLSDDFVVMPDSTLYLSGYRKGRTLVEPDIYVYPAASELDDLDGRGVSLVIEIAASTLTYDLGRKSRLHARYGVRELWVIEADGLLTHVHRAPAESGYGSVVQVMANDRLTPEAIPGFGLRMSDLPVLR